jgi:hemolysin activation/secretion protein
MFKRLPLVFVRWALIPLWSLWITPVVEANMTKSPADESSHPFDVWEFRIEGNTILDNQVIEKTVYQFLGNNKNIATVEEARGALEKAYHDAGYQAALVDIPEQDVREGVVILKVTEGSVDRLRVTGSRYFSPGHIKEKVPALAEGKPLNLPEAQKELSKLSAESPDRQVTPVMRAGTTPGTIDIDLEVKDELPIHGSVELNARNSINTTRLRLPVMLRYDNLWQLNHSASLQYQVSPEDTQNVQVWSGTYVMPIEAIGSRLAMYGIGLDSSSDVTTAGSLNVVGNGNIFGLRLNKPLEENKDIIQTLSFGWDYKDFGQSINPIGDTSQPGQSSPVQYSPFQLGYSASLYQEGGSLSQLNTELNFNFAGMGSSYEQFAKRRYGATPNYFYLAGEVKHKQALPEDLALQVRLSGQVANEPLISNEQMGAGGMLTVRGYHEVERLGDNGVVGSMEFWSPDFGDMGLDGLEYLNDFRMLAFTDAAQLWLIDPLPGTDTGYDLFSSGAGFRLRAFRGLVSELYWEYPFVGTQYVQPGQQRIDFRVAYEF